MQQTDSQDHKDQLDTDVTMAPEVPDIRDFLINYSDQQDQEEKEPATMDPAVIEHLESLLQPVASSETEEQPI